MDTIHIKGLRLFAYHGVNPEEKRDGQTFVLDLRLGAAGESLLAHGMRLMEIKTAHAIPLWLCAALDQNEIRPTSFSKYGRVYEARMRAGQARAMRPDAVKEGVCDAVCHV